MPLADLFPDGDYRFHLTLRRGEPREFFRPRDATGRVRAERRRWLAAEPGQYTALLPPGAPLLTEFAEMCAEWAISPPGSAGELGALLEPDVLFLSPDATGAMVLQGGALCFPTGWALSEKIGHPVDFIHSVVPGLNAAIGAPIRQFLAKLKPGIAFQRDNWGLAATDELNLHPARALPAPGFPVALDRLWLRVEHQALLALPRSGGVVFGIRIALHRLDQLRRDDPAAAAGLRRGLATMPVDLLRYKRLEAVRDAVVERLHPA